MLIIINKLHHVFIICLNILETIAHWWLYIKKLSNRHPNPNIIIRFPVKQIIKPLTLYLALQATWRICLPNIWIPKATALTNITYDRSNISASYEHPFTSKAFKTSNALIKNQLWLKRSAEILRDVNALKYDSCSSRISWKIDTFRIVRTCNFMYKK